jgi:hypothetical protein
LQVLEMRSSHATRSRAATACLLALLGATVVAWAWPAGAARAAVIASSTSGFVGGPALASDGRIVVGERRGNGALRIVAIDPATRSVAGLVAFGPLADRRTYHELTITGTGGIVTAALSTLRQVPASAGTEDQAGSTLRDTRAMAVLPAFVELGRCTSDGGHPPQLAAAGGDDFVATVGDDCAGTRAAVRLRSAAGTRTIPADAGPADSSFRPDISELRATGPMVAWVQTRLPSLDSQLERTLVVARASTGQVLVRAHLEWFPVMLGLGSDGTVALTMTVVDFPCAARIASPAAPVLRRIALAAPFCVRFDAPVAVSGGRFVFASERGYGVSDLQGSVHPLAEATATATATATTGAQASAVAFDGRTAFVVRRDCDADRLLAVDAGAPATAPSAPVAAKTACPVRRTGSGRLAVRRDGTARIALRCPKGCRGTLRLVQQRKGGRERTVGSASYASAAGDVVLRPALARFARGLAGCAGGLRVAAILFATDERRRGLGNYRIVSRARCRRSGGPAFKAPLPAPRP